MTKLLDRLAHHLKVKFGLPPDRPTTDEVVEIVVAAAKQEAVLKRRLTDSEWRTITYEIVGPTEKHVYEGLDFSDLNALLGLIRQQAAQKK